MKSGFWLMIMTVGVSCLVLLPKPQKTWNILSSFIWDFCLELCRSFACWLKGVKNRLSRFGRKLIYTADREWLDETESAITE